MHLVLYDCITQQKTPLSNAMLFIRMPDVETEDGIIDVKETINTDASGEFNLKCKRHLKDGMRPEVKLVGNQAIAIESLGSFNQGNDTITVYKANLINQQVSMPIHPSNYTEVYPVINEKALEVSRPNEVQGVVDTGSCQCEWKEQRHYTEICSINCFVGCGFCKPDPDDKRFWVTKLGIITKFSSSGQCVLKCCEHHNEWQPPTGYTYEGVRYDC